MLLTVFGIPNIASAADITVNVKFDNSTKKVIINGNISTGSGKIITVKVLNPSNEINYFDQETSDTNGNFSFTYTLQGNKTGTYTVSVSGSDAEKPVNADFTYIIESSKSNSVPVPVITPSPVVNTESGKIQPVADVDTATGTVGVTVTQDSLQKVFSNIAADENGIKSAYVEIASVENAKSYSVRLPVDEVAFDDLSRKIKVSTEFSTLEIPNNMLKRLDFSGDKELTINVKNADKSQLSSELKAKVGDRPVIEISASVDGNDIQWNNSDASVKVSIPYKPSPEELKKPENIVVWYIDKAGKGTPVPTGKYNAAEGTVTFKTTHFSMYSVAFVERSFSDLAEYSWAGREIGVLASKGIIEGTSADIFSPSENVTRADFLMLLVKTLGLDVKFDSNFSDVNKSDYYYKALGTAKKLGITTGVGNNMFNPAEPISRQDMMVLCERALKIQKIIKSTGTVSELDKFSDKNQVAEYAQQGISSMVKEGIITGSGSLLSPLDNATRAETAVIMYRIYNKQ